MALNFKYLFGLDLGQVKDYTAIVGVRVEPIIRGKRPTYQVGHIERFRQEDGAEVLEPWSAMGWDFYTKLHARMVALFRDAQYPDGRANPRYGQSAVFLDGTGSGYHVAHTYGQGQLAGVTSLHVFNVVKGEAKWKQRESGRLSVARAEIVDTIQIVASSGRLKFLLTGDCSAESLDLLKDEMKTAARIQPRNDAGAVKQRAGEHDDLVISLGMALWGGERLWEQGAGGIVPVRWI